MAGTSHAVHVKEHVPEWWGIITVVDAWFTENGLDVGTMWQTQV